MGASKIEKLGLVKRVEELISAGIHSSPAISEALKKDGHNISQPTVSRWLKQIKETRVEATQQIIQDHIQKTVPQDLAAIEKMELRCLDQADEDLPTFAHRLAVRHIADDLTKWKQAILNVDLSYTDEKERQKACATVIEDIMSQCIQWIIDEFAFQKNTRGAIRQATQIIELKLRYSGALGSAEGGNIFFLGKEDRLEEDPNTGKLLVFKGGKKDAP